MAFNPINNLLPVPVELFQSSFIIPIVLLTDNLFSGLVKPIPTLPISRYMLLPIAFSVHKLVSSNKSERSIDGTDEPSLNNKSKLVAFNCPELT